MSTGGDGHLPSFPGQRSAHLQEGRGSPVLTEALALTQQPGRAHARTRPHRQLRTSEPSVIYITGHSRGGIFVRRRAPLSLCRACTHTHTCQPYLRTQQTAGVCVSCWPFSGQLKHTRTHPSCLQLTSFKTPPPCCSENKYFL